MKTNRKQINIDFSSLPKDKYNNIRWKDSAQYEVTYYFLNEELSTEFSGKIKISNPHLEKDFWRIDIESDGKVKTNIRACDLKMGWNLTEFLDINKVTQEIFQKRLDKKYHFNILDYTSATGKLTFQCKDCNYIDFVNQAGSIFRRVGCKCCGDGISYPNKFLANVLTQANVDFVREATFEWCRTKESFYSYDLYILILKLLIEIQGGGHKKPKQKKIDNKKKILAQSKPGDVSKFIQILAYKSEKEYMQKNIIRKLGKIIDLSKISWEEADIFACKSLLIEAAKCWDNDMSMNDISKELKISMSTTYTYIKKAYKIGICNRSTKGQKIIKMLELKMVCDLINDGIIDRNILCERSGLSPQKLSRRYNELLNLNLVKEKIPCIRDLKLNELDNAIIELYNKEYLSKIIAEKSGKSQSYIEQRIAKLKTDGKVIYREARSNGKPVVQYSLNGKRISRYNSITEAEVITHIKGIGGCCGNKTKTAGGYIWRFEKEAPSELLVEKSYDGHCKGVVQYDINTGNIIRTYRSFDEAAKFTKVCRSNISYCCLGMRNTAGGYGWRYL